MISIDETGPFLQVRVDRMLRASDLTTAEGRARAAADALTAVAEHPNDLVRDQYVMQIAESCRVDPGRLRERLDYLRAHRDDSPPVGWYAVKGAFSAWLEAHTDEMVAALADRTADR